MMKQISIPTFATILLTLLLLGQIKAQDTTFIWKDKQRGTAQSIYFDRNKNSKFYAEITYFKFLNFDNDSYKYSIDYLKENRLFLHKKNPVITSTKWVTLKQYKGKYYAYHPCDFYNHFRASINDTTYIEWTGEGPVGNKILNQKKIDDQTYEFKLTGINSKNRTIIIHIIDDDKGIAVFEESSKGAAKDYYLMIMADKVRTVPLIVNNCEHQKQNEVNFDTPKYAKLLKMQ